MVYRCTVCDAVHTPGQVKDPRTCPICGSPAIELDSPASCYHVWGVKVKDEDDQIVRRCVKCGEIE